ncbi:MAG: hypothetical protein PHZ19_11925, partial [Candidatus Thermoplasmatota archaeon]|nr:hypothetical protein [Candidatus Thermoplasmatota archaeon]
MYRGRILAIADVPFAASGYGVQTNILMSRLAKRGWDVYQIGGNYWFTGAEEVDAEGCLHYNGIKVIRNFEIRTKGALGLYGSKEFQRRVFDDLQPDVVWTFNDFYRVAGLVEIGQDFLDRWVHYHPMDNPYGGGDWIRYMNCLRFLVFCSSFGWKTHAAPLSDVSFKDALYLAVPGDVFRPLPDKDAVKERHGLRGSFVITTVGRHQPRKMIYQTAYAVGPFLQAHP